MRHNKSYFCPLLLALATLLITACRPSSHGADTWDMNEEQRDSLQFLSVHHYTLGYNFEVTGDSLPLLSEPEETLSGECTVLFSVPEGEQVVVADVFRREGPDSIMVKVACDQKRQGWVSERMLLERIVPEDPISRFIHLFSSHHVLLFISLLLLSTLLLLLRHLHRKPLHIIHFRDIDSLYPTLLCCMVAIAAVFYSAIQMFWPGAWQRFYFQPTLNPFGQEAVTALFLVCVWLIVILLLAAADDTRRRLPLEESVPYLLSLGGVVLLVYAGFALLTRLWVGFPLLPFYLTFAFRTHLRNRSISYRCGACGAKLKRKGPCPRCGRENV